MRLWEPHCSASLLQSYLQHSTLCWLCLSRVKSRIAGWFRREVSSGDWNEAIRLIAEARAPDCGHDACGHCTLGAAWPSLLQHCFLMYIYFSRTFPGVRSSQSFLLLQKDHEEVTHLTADSMSWPKGVFSGWMLGTGLHLCPAPRADLSPLVCRGGLEMH